MNKMLNISILTNVVPIYREGFYERLFSDERFNVKVYCQDEVPGINYKTIHSKYPQNILTVPNYTFKKGLLIWQFLPFLKILKSADVIFIDGNPRIASHAFFATFLQLINKKVVMWSMVHSHLNNTATKNIRICWLRIFKNHFLYNDLDIVKLKSYPGFRNKNILAMNNGLNQKKNDSEMEKWDESKLTQFKKEKGLLGRPIFISCGRLIEKNNYTLVIKALKLIKAQKPNILWICIGDGILRESFKQLSIENTLTDNIIFLGELYEESEQCPWFLSSSFFVHPAGIGLSIMQAFGFGLPVITHNIDKLHGPEFVAFESEKTGVTFEIDNYTDLSAKIIDLFEKEKVLDNMRINVLELARNKYNSEIMYQRFTQMVNLVNNQ